MKLKSLLQKITLPLVILITWVTVSEAQPERKLDKDGLYKEIAHMDSVLFEAFNTGNLEKLKTLFTDDLEFYHDLGGLTGYQNNMESFKSNFEKNNGLRRELVRGSLEVYPVKDYGAMEIGSHTFCHTENGQQDCGTFKFVHIWKRKDGQWKISRVVSYGH